VRRVYAASLLAALLLSSFLLLPSSFLAAPAPAITGTNLNINLPIPTLSTDPTSPRPTIASWATDADAARYATFFSQMRTTRAAMSPDGKYLAYSIYENSTISIVIVPIDHPDAPLLRRNVLTDAEATPPLTDQRENTQAAIRWMRWVTSTRLIIEFNHNFPVGASGSVTGAIVSLDIETKKAIMLATPFMMQSSGFESSAATRPINPLSGSLPSSRAATDSTSASTDGSDDTSTDDTSITVPPPPAALDNSFQPRAPRVIGLCADDPESIYVRAGGAYAYGIFKINVITGKRKNLSEEVPGVDFYNLADRQGKARIILPMTTDVSFPQNYRINITRGLSRWSNLDSNIKPKPIPGSAGVPPADEGRPDPRPIQNPKSKIQNFTVSPDNFFARRSIPLGFDEDPAILYYASNLNRDTYGIYSVNVTTGEHRDFALENPKYDLITPTPAGFIKPPPLIFDRFTHKLAGLRLTGAQHTTLWLRPELQQVQQALEAALPNHIVTILDWTEPATRFLLLAHGSNDRGAYYIYDRDTKSLRQFLRRTDAPDATLSPSTEFAFAAKDGKKITGIITLPQNAPDKNIHTIVVCPNFPWERRAPDYSPEIQALASMGYAVIEVNSRSAFGYGLDQRKSATDAGGPTASMTSDILFALDELAKYVPLSLKHVAVLGENYGGYIALRVAQMHPDRFRCAVAIDAPVDPAEWLSDVKISTGSTAQLLTTSGLDPRAELAAAPLVRDSRSVKRPVLLLSYPGAAGADSLPKKYVAAQRFYESVKANGVDAFLDEITDEYFQNLPQARGHVYHQIETFLNSEMLKFTVDIGPLKIIDDKTPPKKPEIPR